MLKEDLNRRKQQGVPTTQPAFSPLGFHRLFRQWFLLAIGRWWFAAVLAVLRQLSAEFGNLVLELFALHFQRIDLV